MESFLKDLRHSLRMFAASPAFTMAAVAALTLGIGANTAIFSVVNAVLLKPVGVMDPDRVVVFINTSDRGPGGPAASPAKFMHYRQQTGIGENVSALNTGVMNYTGGSFPEQLRSGRVSADFFKLVGAPLLLGRGFTADEDRPQGPNVAFALARLITSILFGVTARDPLAFAGVPILLTLIALIAVWLLARRASKIDPIVALRVE